MNDIDSRNRALLAYFVFYIPVYLLILSTVGFFVFPFFSYVGFGAIGPLLFAAVNGLYAYGAFKRCTDNEGAPIGEWRGVGIGAWALILGQLWFLISPMVSGRY